MGKNIGTADWQRGVVNAGKLIGTGNSGQASIIVSVPPNAETLVVAVPQQVPTQDIRMIGQVTGFYYPGIYRVAAPSFGASTSLAFDVSSQLDDSVEIVFTTAPTVNWYVYIENGISVVNVPELGLLLAENNAGTVPGYGIMSMGYDGNDAGYIAVDSGGRQIPLVPTESTGFINIATGVQVIPAPVNQALYLFGWEAFGNPGVSGSVVSIHLGSLGIAAKYCNLTEPCGGDLNGYRTTSAVTMGSNDSSTYGVIRYAYGP